MSAPTEKQSRRERLLILRKHISDHVSFIGSEGNRYAKIQSLGAGGNSEVFLVRSTSGLTKGCLYALKVFVNIEDATRLERFRQEIAFLKQCNHPSVLRVFETGDLPFTDGSVTVNIPFVVTEYLPKTLRTSILEGIPIADKLAFALQLLAGLRYLASQTPPVTHRDIKPENIFVKGKSCVLGDFGLLKAGSTEDLSADYRVEVSTGIRFPRLYPTPDLIEYSKDGNSNPVITPKSDVFQLGLVLAELFAGVLPLAPREKPFDPVQVQSDDIRVPGSQGAQIAYVIKAMLEIDPAKRPDAEQLLDIWDGPFREVCTLCIQLEGTVF